MYCYQIFQKLHFLLYSLIELPLIVFESIKLQIILLIIIIFSFMHRFLFSLTHVMVVKVLFLSKIFEMEILIDLLVMGSSESENRIFSVWSVRMCVYC